MHSVELPPVSLDVSLLSHRLRRLDDDLAKETDTARQVELVELERQYRDLLERTENGNLVTQKEFADLEQRFLALSSNNEVH